MRIVNTLKALALTFWAVTGVALAAPIPSDVPDKHWAQDAVATLSERGLIEGYADDTFKGDRALTRWELAALVARLMAKLEESHTSFATQAELNALQRLADNLRPELQALGVRVGALEQRVQNIDDRVTDLERITFYGSMSTVIGAQSFWNTSKNGIGNHMLDYEHIVGTATGAGGIIDSGVAAGMPMNPFVFGNMTVTDWSSGLPLTNGTSCSAALRLGTKVRITNDLEGGAEFAAYSSVGDNIVDAYWGVNAPYNANRFTAAAANGTGQGINNQPYTRMVLDNFWLEHKPSRTKLVLGYFGDTNFDDFIYASPINPNWFGIQKGQKHLGNYGLKLNGTVAFSDDEKGNKIQWEIMGTRLPDGNVNSLFPEASYFTHSEGGNIAFLFDEERGRIRGNYLHTSNNATNGEQAVSGLYLTPNMNLNWVNPNGYYLAQMTDPHTHAGIGSGTDIRPIAMIDNIGNDGMTGVPGVPNVGAIGPQEMHSYGLSGRYQFDVACQPEIFAEYGHTEYKPNKRSSYTVGGDMYRFGAKAKFGKNKYNQDIVGLNVSYRSVDPTYDPFILPMDTVGGISTVMWRSASSFSYINSLYSLHDTDIYIHNRKGIDADLTWQFLPIAKLNIGYSNCQQVETSQQDVRYTAGSLGAMTPNSPVLGFSPGFIDAVFCGFSPYTYAPSGGNGWGSALEDPRGFVEQVYGSIGFKVLLDDPTVSKRGITIGGGGRDTHFLRRSELSNVLPGADGLRGENQNNVDIRLGGWKIFVNYEPSDDLRLDFSVNNTYLNGHLDPLGILNEFAVTTGDTRAKIVDLRQIYPQIKVDYDVNSAWNVGLVGRYYWTTDKLPIDHDVNARFPGMNIDFGVLDNAHPVTWNGWQVMTYCNFMF